MLLIWPRSPTLTQKKSKEHSLDQVNRLHILCSQNLIYSFRPSQPCRAQLAEDWPLSRLFATKGLHIFCGEYKARSDCTYVQSDLALHSPLFYQLSLAMKPHLVQFNLLICDKSSKFNPLPSNLGFEWPWERSIFSFYLNIFYRIKDKFFHLSHL